MSSSLNEPVLGDIIYLLDHLGRPGNKLSKVMRVVSEDKDEDLWEVVDKRNQTVIVAPGSNDREWIEVEL